ncbi:replicative DNA helicase [Candidatus Kaiserbacteria bacterium]|nr:replicative DNA helicase [Candidatus Kaiserbacteria bacterium]
MTDVRIPPQDLDTERALLGAIMLNPSAMYEIADVLVADSFYAAKHKTIYDAMLSLYARGEPVDLISLSARLKEKKALDKVGGNSYLSELVGVTVSPGSAQHYAHVIRAKGVLRSLIGVADEIAQLGFQEDRDIEEILNDAQSKVFRIANTSTLRKFTDLRTELRETWERVERLSQSKGELRGVPTGFPTLDNKLAGLQKADLIILAARPSMGKTSLALDIARRAAVEHKVPVGVFSLEMSAQQLTERMLAATSYVDAWKLRTGRGLTERDYENLQHAIGVLDEAPIYIDDTASNTVLAMRSTARRLKAEKGLGLVVIDYLQLTMPTSTRTNDSMVQQVTEISRGLKAMARELDVPVLALSQLSREVEKRGGRPKLSDLRESGSIEQDADVVLFIHREDKDKRYQDAGEVDNGFSNDFKKEFVNVEVIIAKHRNGPVGMVKLHFKEDQTRFESVSSEESVGVLAGGIETEIEGDLD